ncbi:hypothetical protein ACPV4H_08780 [Vibrio rotiferianus]|uniref:hypothetical protein n=1 Tax=Vibrio rotiferianus TaxID=190895 RepID=UPI00406A1538
MRRLLLSCFIASLAGCSGVNNSICSSALINVDINSYSSLSRPPSSIVLSSSIRGDEGFVEILCDAFSSQDVRCTHVNSVISPLVSHTTTEVKELLIGNGIDGFLRINLISSSGRNYSLGVTSQTTTNMYGSIDQLGNFTGTAHSRTTSYEQRAMSSNLAFDAYLYNVETGDLIYKASLSSSAFGNSCVALEVQAHEIGNELSEDLVRF